MIEIQNYIGFLKDDIANDVCDIATDIGFPKDDIANDVRNIVNDIVFQKDDIVKSPEQSDVAILRSAKSNNFASIFIGFLQKVPVLLRISEVFPKGSIPEAPRSSQEQSRATRISQELPGSSPEQPEAFGSTSGAKTFISTDFIKKI